MNMSVFNLFCVCMCMCVCGGGVAGAYVRALEPILNQAYLWRERVLRQVSLWISLAYFMRGCQAGPVISNTTVWGTTSW